MLKLVSRFALLSLLGASLAAAQALPDKIASALPKIPQPLPFKIGETLTYEITFSKLIFSGTIGELKLTVSRPPDTANAEMFQLDAAAASRGFFPSLLKVKVKDHYTSVVNPGDFTIQTSTKLLDEGKVRREQKSVFNRESGLVTYTDRDLVHEKSVPRVKEKASPSWVQDLLSTVYFVRTQPLKEGDVIPVPISDGGEVYNIEILVGKPQEVKTSAGNVKAIPLNAKVFNGRYIKRSGEMLVWVTDDEARIPVRAKIKTTGATISVELKRMPRSV